MPDIVISANQDSQRTRIGDASSHAHTQSQHTPHSTTIYT